MAEKVVKRYELNPDDYPSVFDGKNIVGLCYLVKMKCKEERKTEATGSAFKTSCINEYTLSNQYASNAAPKKIRNLFIIIDQNSVVHTTFL